MSKDFVHLHVHSHYSLLDGAAKVQDLIHMAEEYKMPALALTDHGNLFGAMEFYQTAKKTSVKPIIGYEAYVAPVNRTKKEKQYAKSPHITLLAKDYDGYKNLIKLASEAYLSGFYYKPRIDKDLLYEHRSGLVALSGCLASEVCKALARGETKEAKEVVSYYKDVFGDDYYIEVQKNDIEVQAKVNKGLVKLAKEFDLPLVYTNDIHYLHEEDANPHEVLLCIQTGDTMDNPNRFKFGSNTFYMKDSKQMYEESQEFPNAAKNTLEIAEKVNIDIPIGDNHLPPFDVPEGKSNEQYLRELCEKGLEDRYEIVTSEIKDRFEMEFNVINNMGFPSYFLIVWDFINFARKNGIPVGPGRGSAAGSIIAYALGITNLDPIKYKLIFERFLNEGRQEMPDIDIDFETQRRGEVIEYVSEKYGKRQVSQIITFGTMAARAVIRDVGRALNVPLGDVDKIAKKVPTGPKITLQKALEMDPDFKKLYDSDPTAKKILDIAKRLEGLNRQPGTHAAGVIISDKDLTEYCPLYQNPKDKTIATQYSMEYMESLGLLKMDFLGLSTLSLIQKTQEIIKHFRGIDLDIDKIPIDSQETFDMLCRGETKGVFQLESDGMRELVKKLKPDRFEDIIALVALYRPGPLGSGMVDTYCRCKHGQEEAVYKHPVLKDILEETYGIILYQEQAMQIAKDFSGFSLVEADRLRKAMGKKKKDLMDKYRQLFIDGAKKIHNVEKELSQEIFDLIDYFSGYGFNKSHSAAYALVSYQTAYLKALYPSEFMAALMTIESQNTDKIVKYIHECETMNIKVFPPSINESEASFSVNKDGILFGLAAIKGVGEKAVDPIIEARQRVKKFNSIFHICEEVDTRLVNKQVLEALVKSGSMDCFELERSQIFSVIPDALQVGGNIQKQRQSNQMTLFDFDDLEEDEETSGSTHTYKEVDPWTEKQKLQYEKETLGFFFSGHPLKKWAHYMKMLSSHQIKDLRIDINSSILLGGMISQIRVITIKSGRNQGRKMAQVVFEDFTGSCNIICFPDLYENNMDTIQEDQILFIRGRINTRKDEPELLADEVITVEKGLEKIPASIVINIKGKTEEDIQKLIQVCNAHRGDCRTMLDIERDGFSVLIEVAEKYYLHPNPVLFKDIEKVLDPKAVYLRAN